MKSKEHGIMLSVVCHFVEWPWEPLSIQMTQEAIKIYLYVDTRQEKTESHVDTDNRVRQLKWFSEDLEIISELRKRSESSWNSVCVPSEMLEESLQKVWELEENKSLLLI